MTYTLEWLKTFDGEIDILNVKMDAWPILLRKMFSVQIYLLDRLWRTVLKLFYQSQTPPFLIY